MAVGLIFQVTGVSLEQYQQVLDEACPDNQLPPGMLYHAAGPGPTGMCVIDIWDSEESMQAFETEKLRHARQRANITAHQVTIFPIINIMQP